MAGFVSTSLVPIYFIELFKSFLFVLLPNSRVASAGYVSNHLKDLTSISEMWSY